MAKLSSHPNLIYIFTLGHFSLHWPHLEWSPIFQERSLIVMLEIGFGKHILDTILDQQSKILHLIFIFLFSMQITADENKMSALYVTHKRFYQ